MNRNPPTSVVRALRQEVGFGCPIRRSGRPCGNPYLEYHHFDPEWAVAQHHNPDGMIALCHEHHAKAGGGAFPLDYLKKLKLEAAASTVQGHFDWLLRDYIVVMGGAFAANTTIPIAYSDRPIISFFRDPSGLLLMNLDMPTASIAPRLRMWESTWYERGEPKDMECPPSGRLLKVHYKNGDYLRGEFIAVTTAEDFAKRYPKIVDIGPAGLKYPATAIEIELRLTEADLHINKDVFRVGGIELKDTIQHGGNWFIGIGSHEPITRLSDFIGYSPKQFAPRLRLASQNSNELLPVDKLHFKQQVLSLDGYSYIDCTFTKCRLMFSGRPFGLKGCKFDASDVVLTDEAVSTCRALDLLQKHAGLDVADTLEKLTSSYLLRDT